MDALEHAKTLNLPRLTWDVVFAPKASGEPLTEADIASLNAYMRQFTIREGGLCPGCDAKLTGDLAAQVMGLATFEWSLAHGEGQCRTCKYPARAYHRDVGPIEFFNLVLPYHPDELRKAEDVSSTEAAEVL